MATRESTVRRRVNTNQVAQELQIVDDTHKPKPAVSTARNEPVTELDSLPDASASKEKDSLLPANKLKADIINALQDDANDTELMRQAQSDIKGYLETITTNIVSSEKTRKDLITRLDIALGEARKEKHDAKLIKTYRELESELRNIKLGHKIIKSDLLETVSSTITNAHSGVIEITRKKDLEMNEKLDTMKKENSEMNAKLDEMKKSMGDMTKLMQAMMEQLQGDKQKSPPSSSPNFFIPAKK